MRNAAVLVVLLLSFGLEGCEGCDKAPSTPQANSSPAPATTPEAEPGRFGTVEGVVRLIADAELPSYPEETGPGRAPLPASCAPFTVEDRTPVKMLDGRLLAGMMLTGTDFDTDPPITHAVHEVAIRNCRLTPALIVASAGDKLNVLNDTDHPFFLSMGEEGVQQVLLAHKTRERNLTAGGLTMGCGFATPCGRTDVFVMHHAVHTVTDAAGHYRITNIPVGEDVKIHAWHPLFHPATATVRIERAGEVVRRDLEVRPNPMAPPPPEAPRRPGHPEDQGGLF